MALADSNNHFVMLVLLRRQLLVNGLRHSNRRAEFVMQGFLGLFWGSCVLLVSAAFLGMTYAFLRLGQANFIDFVLLALFLLWQLAPIVLEGYSPALNFREVARYPISFRTYFLLGLAYGFFDPAALACLIWLASIWLGVLIVRPDLAASAALAFLLFTLFNLVCNRVVIGLFERFQSTRKGRERMALITLVLLLLPQLVQFYPRLSRGHVLHLPATTGLVIQQILAVLPSGLAAHIFISTGAAAFQAIAGLLLLTGLFFILLFRQMHAIFQGEIYSEGFIAKREFTVHSGWQFPIADAETSAIMEKELRYLRQNSRLILQLIVSPVVFILFIFNSSVHPLGFAAKPSSMLAVVAGFLLLSLPNVAYNTFGMDNQGFGRWLLSPIPLRKVLIAKNLVHGIIFGFLYVTIAFVVISFEHIALLQVVTVTVLFFALLILQLGIGNLFSVHWPKRVDLAQMNTRMASSTSGITAVLIMLVVMSIYGLVVFIASYWNISWLALAFGFVLLMAALKLYDILINQTVAYTYTHIEEITGNLST